LITRYSVSDGALLHAGQEPGQQAGQRQEGADPVDLLDTDAVSQSTQDGRRDPRQPEVEAIEQALD
jgi:hypothetical protein